VRGRAGARPSWLFAQQSAPSRKPSIATRPPDLHKQRQFASTNAPSLPTRCHHQPPRRHSSARVVITALPLPAAVLVTDGGGARVGRREPLERALKSTPTFGGSGGDVTCVLPCGDTERTRVVASLLGAVSFVHPWNTKRLVHAVSVLVTS
jgi:hypothetical protein